MAEYLKHSHYPRDGYQLDIGRLWEIDCGYSMRELDVFANANGVRIRDMGCGEWEMAERAAIYLSAERARQLGEILLAAAEVVERNADMWQRHSRMADPGPRLRELLAESVERMDREIERERQEAP